MHIPFIVLALAFSTGSTISIILLVERHIIRSTPAREAEPAVGLEGRRDVAA